VETIQLKFAGPFSWAGVGAAPSLFEDPMGNESGIYLWTVSLPQGHLIYYIGETGRSFATRMLEHYKEHASGFYHVYSPAEFANGRKVPLWPGRGGKSDRKSVVECMRQYAQLSSQIAEMTQIYRFFLAPTKIEVRIRRRVEAAIAIILKSSPGQVGGFQDEGVGYSPRLAGEEPISCLVLSDQPLIGMPSNFEA
jgi:hypothetical protein